MHEQIRQRRTVFEGRLVCVDVADTQLADGRRTTREIVRHPGAAVVLAERKDGRFVLVRQYRSAVGRVLVEAVAGTLEADETPATCARRELEEETGYTVIELSPLGEILPAPGYSEEVLHAWHALVAPGGKAMPDADEALEVVVLTRAEIDRLIDSGELTDGKTLAIWALYRRPTAGGLTSGNDCG